MTGKLLFKAIKPFFFLGMRILSAIVFIATIIAAFGGKINPDYLTFPALLSLTFPFLAIFTILFIIFWIMNRKIFFSAFGILTIIICLTPLSEAFPLGGSRKPSEGASTFKIISWNIIHTWDLRQKDYPGNRAVEYLINSDADIICLAELVHIDETEIPNFTPALKDSLNKAYPYHAGLERTDIKVLSKYPVERMNRISYNHLGNSRFDFFKVSFPDHELIVAMVHLYSYGLSEEERRVMTEINSMQTAKTSMKEFKGSIRKKLREAFRHRAEDAEILRQEINSIPPDIPLIVCGDFNDVPTSWTYNIIRGDDLRDAYAETNFGPAVTYNLHAFYFHIDQMLYRGPIQALDLSVAKINTSDHYPLVAEFEFDKTQ